MKVYARAITRMTDEKAIEYLYGNGYVDLKIVDYITKRINGVVRRGKWEEAHHNRAHRRNPLRHSGVCEPVRVSGCEACGGICGRILEE